LFGFAAITPMTDKNKVPSKYFFRNRLRMDEGPTRAQLRQELFESMEACSLAFNANRRVDATWRLMQAIFHFYHPYPPLDDLITLDSATEVERIIAHYFLTTHNRTRLSFDYGNAHYYDDPDNCRIAASALVFLRIEFVPEFMRAESNRIVCLILRDAGFMSLCSNEMMMKKKACSITMPTHKEPCFYPAA
ncbi:hypothetical protein PMAYCL1PPCAC_10747, partial [Pristionchus mayeri]